MKRALRSVWLGVLTSSAEGSLSGVKPSAESRDTSLWFSEEQVVLRFSERVRLFAARRLNDAAAAEDVAQETLRRVVEAFRTNRIENVEALPGFVFQTARNLCMHWVRSTAREKSAFARLERESAEANSSPDALANLISAERAYAVRRAIDRLTIEDRRLLAMFYYDGIDTDEISARLHRDRAHRHSRYDRRAGGDESLIPDR